MLEFYRQEMHISRKNRVCEMCRKTIGIGDTYSIETGKYDGEFFQRILHPECFDVLNRYCRDTDDEEFDYYAITNWWREHYCNGNCKHYYQPCKPDSTCAAFCKYRNAYGKCEADDPCYKMTRVCWCDEYERIRKRG